MKNPLVNLKRNLIGTTASVALALSGINALGGAFVSDYFSSGSLDTPPWTFVDPVGDSTAVVVGGVLQISVPAGVTHQLYPPNKTAARVMQSVANTDFGVEVKFDSAPSMQYQEQGLIVDQDANNYLAFEVYSDGPGSVKALVRNVAGGGISFPVSGVSLTAAQAHYYVRVTRVGNSWTFEYSYDGTAWTTVATFTQSLTVGGIGVYAANEPDGTSPAFTALVDYVANTASPVPTSGLALWLRADAGVSGSPVSQWSDQSDNARNATQGTGGNQPTLVNPVLNGQPVVRFDGANDFLTFNLPVNGWTEMTMILVAANTVNSSVAPGAQQAALFWNESVAWGATYLSPFQTNVNFRFGTIQPNNNSVYSRPASVGSGFTLTTAIKIGSTDSLYVNGIQRVSQGGKLATIAGSQDTGNVGRGFNNNTYFTGDIAEVLVYNRALSAAERRNLEVYLDGKYALTTPAAPTIFTQANSNAASGYQYQYQVIAEGSPAPHFTLSSAPVGMTLDGDSGVLNWTPTSGDVGDHLITVNAINSGGTDSQTYTLRVRQLPAGLVSYWPLDETSGTGYSDVLGGNNAVCLAPTCPLPAAGQVNGGQGFNNVTATRISAPAHPSLDFGNTDSFSLEAWVRTDLAAEVTYLGRLDSNDTLEYSIGHDVAGRPWFYLRDSLGNRITNLIAPSVAPFNQWHHIVGVMDANAQQARIYVDGVLANTKSTAGVFTGTFSSPTAAMDLGWLNLHGGYHLRGTLDELALYGRALSGSEIATHYANGVSGIGIGGGTASPTITSAAPPATGTVGTAYNFTVTATGTAPITFTAPGLPTGLTISGAGVISGTPTTEGTFNGTITAANGTLPNATQAFSIVVSAAGGAFVSDDFSSGSLNTTLWTFVDPLADSTATVVGGVLQISVPAGVAHQLNPPNKTAARVMQSVANTDFGVEVKFDSAPSMQYQEQGLIVDQDANNYLAFEVYSDGSGVNALVRQVVGGVNTFPLSAPLSSGQLHYYVRVARVGSTWTYEYSYDGTVWVPVGAGTFTQSLTVGGIGVYAGNEAGATSPAFTALVDYAFNTNSPIVGAPTITSAAPPATGTVGTAYNFTVTATGTAPITFTAPGLPTGLTISSAGVISGTPTTAGTFAGTITAANGTLPNATQAFSIVVSAVPVAPTITSAAPPATGTVGTAYNFTVTATGTVPITFTAPGLPTGLTISGAGVISGTPTTAGTFAGTITAANGTLPNATQAFSIVVSAVPVAPTITSAAPPATGTVGTAYNFTVTATGTAPITFTAPGLPTGLTISGAGVISGTPTTEGTFNGTITAANGTLPNATQAFSIVVSAAGGAFVSDDFSSGSLNTTLWTFVDPLADSTATVVGGVLQISVPAGVAHQLNPPNKTAARVMQSVANTDFGVEVKFDSAPSMQYQEQGLIVDQDANNYLAFEVYSDGSGVNALVRQVVGGVNTFPLSAPLSSGQLHYYVRVARVGSTWTYEYSYDGTVWAPVGAGTFTQSLTVGGIGVYAGNEAGATSPAFTALVDYAFNTNSPIVGAPTITSAAPPATGTVGTAYNFTVTATGTAPITFTAPGLPTGLTISSAGVISGTPTTAGTFAGTITAANGTLPNATQAFSIVVSAVPVAPTITSAAPPATGTVGTAYNFTVTATGTVPITFTAPGLPTGLTISGAGVISGTPTTAGTFAGTITAANGTLPNATQAFSIVVSAVPVAPTITSAAPPATGTVGTAYNFTVTATGTAPITFTAPGLPTGLTISGAGVISGTPTTEGTFNGTITAANGTLPNATQAFSIVVSAAGGAFVSDDFSSGSLNTTLWTFVDPLADSTATVVGGVLQISVPAGVAHQLNPPNKTAARVMQSVANTDFGVEVKFDSVPSMQYQEQGLIVDQDANNYLAFEVYSDGSGVNALVRQVVGGVNTFPLSAPLSSGQLHYYVRVARVGSTWTYEYSYDGTVWAPVGAGTFTQSLTVGGIGVYAGNEAGATSPAFTALVDYAFNTNSPIVGAPTITSAAPPATGTVGTAYNFTVTATGTAPITFTAPGLPTGLTISGAGVISGTPTTEGTFNGTITAANGTLPNATQAFSIVVSAVPVAPTITSAAPPGTGTVGTAYNFTVTATGTAPITFTAPGLPTGLTISSAGVISGTPTTEGTFNGTITAANGTLPNATQAFSIVVSAVPVAPTITSAAPPGTGTVGTAYNFTVTATGTAPITFTAPGLPTGLTISGAGVISGTPTTEGTFNGTITAANGTLPNATQAFSIVVSAVPVAPTITSAAPPATGTVGTAYNFTVTATGTAPITFTAPGLPTGLTISGAGVISGTPTTEGTFNGTITAANGTLPNATQAFSIVVSAVPVAPTITSAAPPGTGTVGTAYSFTVTATGTAPITFTAPGLPTGLTISSAGVISGTPTTEGTFNGTITAANGTLPDATQGFSIVISAPGVFPANLVSYWPLDETSGAVFSDLFGVNNGECVSPACPVPGAGRVNGGQVFDGATTQISASAHPSMDFADTESFTLEAWVKTSQADLTIYLGRYGTTMQMSIGQDGTGKPWFYLRDNLGNVLGELIAPVAPALNEWHHVVGVRDAVAQEARIYVDGVLTTNKSTAGVLTGGFNSATDPLTIGWLSVGGGFHFLGTLDELALYRRALDASEILNHYTDGLAGIGIGDAPPVVENPIANQPGTSGTYGTGFNFQFAANTFTDPNGDPLTYSASGMPLGIGFTSANRTFTGTPTQVGVFPVKVIASDPGNLKATNIFNIAITNKSVTITSGIVANDKAYDGTPSATIRSNSVVLNGVLGADAANVKLSTNGYAASFGTAGVGTSKAVTVGGLSLTGSAAGNYLLTQPAGLTADITNKSVTITSGIVANDKAYDGTPSATIRSNSVVLNGVLGADAANVKLSTNGYAASFGTAGVGTSKAVTVGGLSLTGSAAGNYLLTQPAGLTADITNKSVTITSGIVANDKAYDGTPSATIRSNSVVLNGVLGADAANVKLSTNGYAASFGTAGVGTSKAVTVGGLSLTGSAAGNYLLTQPAGLTADITNKSVTITSGIVANDKAYDGTPSATIRSNSVVLNGVLGADAANVKLSTNGYAASFGTAGVGTGKAVTVGGLSLTGSAAGNYLLTQPAGLTADITAYGLTVTGITAADKVYDSTQVATLNTGGATLVGKQGSDVVTLNVGSAIGTFDTKNVGAGKTVQVAGLTISGADSPNYALSQPTTTASITPASLVATGITANNKTYDGTNSATLITSGATLERILPLPIPPGDIAFKALFTNDTSSNLRTYTTSGNYQVGSNCLVLAAIVNSGSSQRIPTNFSGNGLAWQQILTTNFNTLGTPVNCLTVYAAMSNNISALGSGTVEFAASQTGCSIYVCEFTNVWFAGGAMGAIVQAEARAANSSVNPSNILSVLQTHGSNAVVAFFGGDTFPLGAAPEASWTEDLDTGYSPPASGMGVYHRLKTTDNGLVLTRSAGDWASVMLELLALDTGALVGPFDGDDVTLNTGGAIGTFMDANAASGKTVTISGVTLSGLDAGNYNLAPGDTAVADIEALGLTGSIVAADKVYDGTLAAVVTSSNLVGVIAPDAVTLVVGAASFDNKNVGTRTASAGLSLSGAQAGNYSVNTPATDAAQISQRDMTVQAGDATRGFGSANPIFTATFNGLQPGDDITATFACAALPASAPGNYPIVPSLVDPNDRLGNYTVTLVNGTLTVTAVATSRALTVTNYYSSPGSLVNVVVNLAAQGDENSLAFSLAFDPALTYLGFAEGNSIPSGSTFVVDEAGAGTGALGIQASLLPGTTFQSGRQQLVTLTFQVSAAISAETSLPINFTDQPEIRQVADATAVLVPANYVGGSVTVYTGVEGDATGNGTITATDWTLVGRIVAGLSTISDPGQFMRVDCAPRSTKGNGSISASDWTQVGRYAGGLDDYQTIGGAAEPSASPAQGASISAGGSLSDDGGIVAQGISARSLRVVGTGAEVGDIVKVPVELTALGDENTVSFSLTFDPANLEFLSATAGSGLPSGTQVVLNTNKCSSGRIGALVGVSPGTTFTAETHQMLVLTLRVKSAGDGRLRVSFGDSPVSREIVSSDANELEGDFMNAAIVVGGGQNVPNVLTLDVSQMPDAGTRLTMNGTPNQSYQILVSSDLAGWTVLSTVTAASNGRVEAWDAEANLHAIRFYRAVAQRVVAQ